MTTLPPSPVKNYPETSIEKIAYSIAESLSDYLPVMNDRNRLGFNLYRHLKGEGDDIFTIVRTNKFTIEKISREELVSLIEQKVQEAKQKIHSEF